MEVADQRNVIVVCKATIEDSNTWKAQGGIAAVLRQDDSFEVAHRRHAPDGLRALRAGHGRAGGAPGAGAGPATAAVGRRVRPGQRRHRHRHLKAGTPTPASFTATATRPAGPSPRPSSPRSRASRTSRIIEHFFTIDLLTDRDNRCIGIIGRVQESRPADHLGGQHDPRHRRRRATLSRDDQSARRHRRRPGDGLSGRRGPA